MTIALGAESVHALDERFEAPALEAVADVQIREMRDAQAAQRGREPGDLDAWMRHVDEASLDVEAPDERGADAEGRRQRARPEQRETRVRARCRVDGEQHRERTERRRRGDHRSGQRDQHEAEREERSLEVARGLVVARGDREARDAPGADRPDERSAASERRDRESRPGPSARAINQAMSSAPARPDARPKKNRNRSKIWLRKISRSKGASSVRAPSSRVRRRGSQRSSSDPPPRP